ncbi:unnamed protein product [Rotaria socialis]|uniref:MULE transposase domain-containing protein n=2 Tax=Rotaria socialis TaxID=392032 RepID=A0A820XBJ1_9BILA|nr:unnamed protein product [Rotaria socialis]CAF3537493.1 unnamed protein product [Rotaria socialis]CAF4532099.1 unnamed protein product [Rotaria socialis]
MRCVTGPGDDRILIFASDEQLNILQNAREFIVDGTFKVVPEIFYQLYIIHSVHRDHVIPVIYVLLHRKNADTYYRLINKILKFAPRWSPRSIMLDFEQACIGVYQTMFPTVLLSGCYFHLRQSIHRKLQALRHKNQYESDPLFAHNVHKIAALAFLEPTNVINGFEHLSIDLGDDYETILDYFEETYIAYNRRISSVFRCAHPTLWLFLQKLIGEENAIHADILHINAGQPPTKKKVNQRFENRVINLITTPHRNVLAQIDSIAHNISL